MRKLWITVLFALGWPAGPVQAMPAVKVLRVGAIGRALFSIEKETDRGALNSRFVPQQNGKARLAMPVGAGDQVGLAVSRSKPAAWATRSVSAVVGMWGDDKSVELGAFQDQPGATASAGASQIVRSVSGRSLRARGVRLTGSLYGAPGVRAPGWSIAFDARHQQTSDLAEALRGARHTIGDARLSLNGKLRF